ncbi:MAG TPA: nodulation protein NfeD [Steroidobacteraceae bacterium]|nr:nodulation protein NfeD [Steroidobacteraceae bacterium]
MTGSARRKAAFPRAAIALLALVAGLLSLASPRAEPGAQAEGVLIPVTGAIGPATSDFFVRQLAAAQESGAHLVVLRIDTPGGLETAMRDMIQAILGADVPVIAFVAPSGARAASAGTYLMYASHVAAMAPATNLGAATPVQIGGAPSGDEPTPAPSRREGKDKGDRDKADGEDESSAPLPGSAMERKAVNDSVAYIRGLAELRGRNADWAERAVREGASLPAQEALTENVIDFVASDLPELLRAIDGRVVKLQSREVTLQTAGIVLREVQTDWRTELLQLITNPNVAYLLMLIGIYGLLLEGYNPGSVLPGVVGAISLLLALFAFQVLSVNYAGLALIALGVLLIVAESFVPSFGTLGLGGIVAFVIGSVILLDSDVPGFSIAWQLIATMGFAGSLLLLAIVSFAVRARRRPVVSGHEGMLREHAEAVEAFDRRGLVRVHGELWNAVTHTPVQAGQRLRIVRVDGLTLQVEPAGD